MNEDRQTAARVKRLLDESAQQISPDIQARLNDSIHKALEAHALKAAQTKATEKPRFKTANSSSGLGGILESFSNWFNRPALSLALSAVFVMVSASAVVKYGIDYQNANETETVELDAAILADDLPPDAYLDPGFINFTTRQPRESQLPSDDAIDQWLQSIPADGQTSI